MATGVGTSSYPPTTTLTSSSATAEAAAPGGGYVSITTGGVSTTTTTTTTTTTYDVDQYMFENGVEISSRTDTHNTGERLIDASLSTYIRSINVEFQASGLEPNLRVFPYFNDVNVGKYCRPLDGEWGGDLITDAKGSLTGVFCIPPNTFYVGAKVFRLSMSETEKSSEEFQEMQQEFSDVLSGG